MSNNHHLLKPIIIFVLLFLVFHFLISTMLFAEEKPVSLEELVVTATRIEEPKEDVSASVQIITKEDIKNSTAKNAGDLISEASLGHLQKYPNLFISSIGLRGLRTDIFDDLKSRVLLLINGHRIGSVNLAEIPIESIEKIEIVKGPSSVLYGSSAMGGVINIITKQTKEEGIHGFVGGEFGSWGYWKSQVELTGKKSSFDYYVIASRSAKDDYDSKDYGKIENTGYNNEDVSIRFGYSFLNNHHISLEFQHWRGWEIGSPGPIYSLDPDDYTDIGRDGLNVGYETETFKATYYFNKDKYEWHEGKTAGMWETPNSVDLKETDVQGVSLQKTFIIGDHRIIVGGQWDRIEVESSRTAGAPYNPNSRYDSYGIFSEGRLSLFNKRLLLNAGIRYDYFENEILATPGITSIKKNKEEIDHVTIRGGLVYKITDDIRIKGNIGSAFRAPAPDELATDYVSDYGIHYIGNPELKPESSVTYDIGIDYRKGLLKSELTFFNTEFRDKILSYYDGKINALTFKNVDGATFQGFEGNLSYDVGLAIGLKFSIEPFMNITYHTRYSSKDKLEISNYGKTLLYTPKWTGAFGVRAGYDKWDARLIANYTGDEKVQDWSEYPYPVVKKADFTVVNLKGSYRPIKNLEVMASIENLFDRAYEYVQYYPMPRRTVVVGMRWIF